VHVFECVGVGACVRAGVCVRVCVRGGRVCGWVSERERER
jgi:hypothetical protein